MKEKEIHGKDSVPLCADSSSADEKKEIALRAPDERTQDTTGITGLYESTKEAPTEEPEK